VTDAPNTLIEKQQAWYKAVAGVFARVQKKDVADIPLDIWQKLIKTTYDGIPINPLYNRADELDEAALPGVFPYRRGAAGVGQENQGWGVAESFDEKSTNQQVLDSLYNGTTNLVIQGSADIATLLNGVYLSLCPVRLFAGVRTVEQAKALFAVADSQQEPPQLIELGATPLTSMVNGGATISLDDTIELAKQAAQRDNTRAILVDAVTFSNQGATDAEEIGLALAAGVEYLRALTDAGFTVEQALDQISFRFATTDDQFAQIAKFRAARQLWARVAEIVGDLLHELGEYPASIAIERLQDEILSRLSCHKAVRAHDSLTIPEMNHLLRDIETTPASGQCNHGRPTWVQLTTDELGKYFMRGE